MGEFQSRHKSSQDTGNSGNKDLAERFDFGNGDIEKQEKKEHYFRMAK